MSPANSAQERLDPRRQRRRRRATSATSPSSRSASTASADTDGDGIADKSAGRLRRLQRRSDLGHDRRRPDGRQRSRSSCVPPGIYRLHDAKGDGTFNQRSTIGEGMNIHPAFGGHGISGVLIGPDGRLYWEVGDIGLNVTDRRRQDLGLPEPGRGDALRVRTARTSRCSPPASATCRSSPSTSTAT